MKAKDWSFWGLIAIAGTTVLTGFIQIVRPKALLRALAVENTPTSRHFFATIGMFMVIVGGVLLHVLSSHSDSRIPVLWTGLQKFGASAAVALGVKRAVFPPFALLVAGFDFVSSILAIGYWVRTWRVPAERKANV